MLSRLTEFRILPRIGERLFGNRRGLVPTARGKAALRQEIRKAPATFSSRNPSRRVPGRSASRKAARSNAARTNSSIALRKGDAIEVFPGALTRIAPEGSLFTAAGLGGGSKDTWVLSADAEPITLQSRSAPFARDFPAAAAA